MRTKFLVSVAALAIAAIAGPSFAQNTAAPMAPAPAPTAGDQAGDASTSAILTPGTPVTAAVQPAGDKDWYKLRVRAGQLYTITMRSTVEGDNALDTVLRVVGRNGEELASNDDDGDTLNSKIEFMPGTSGDVFVEAGAFNAEATGGYTLAVTESALPPDDVRGDKNTHNRLTLGEAAHGAINFSQDKDWFKVRLREGRAYRFSLNGAGEGEAALDDPMLRILGPGGEEEVARDDDGGEGLNSYLEYTPTRTGTYYAEVSAFNPQSHGGYELIAREGEVPGDVHTDATISPGGDTRESTLAPGGDKDWYKLHLDANQTVRIAVNSPDQGGIGDPIVAVYNAAGGKLGEDDDGGEGLNSLLEFTAPSAGDYFVEVRAYAEDAQGKYDLTVTDGEIGNTVDTADTLSANDEGRTSVLQTPNDVDWFAITMVEGRPYRFNVSGEGEGDAALTDPMLTLYDAEGHQVAQDDDGGPGLNPYISYTSVEGGTYYAAVSSYNSAGAGHYRITAVDTDISGTLDTDENLADDGDDRASFIDIAGDKDDFRVELHAGSRYEFTLSGNGDNALSDPFLTLLNSSGETITSDDDSGPGLDARIRFTAPEDDVVYLQASGLGGATGGYKIEVKRLSMPSVRAPLPPGEPEETHPTPNAPVPPPAHEH
jgi:hypothetical protein